MTVSVARVVEVLLLAERQIRLLERVRPLGLTNEIERLVSAWERGFEPFADLRYATCPDLSRLREGLALVVERGSALGGTGSWLAARAEELALEAEMAQRVGTHVFSDLAAKRFALPAEAWAMRSESLVQSWLILEEPNEAIALYRTDDRTEPNSLFSVLRRRLDDLRVRACVRSEPELNSVAATGDGMIRILAGVNLSLRQAKRIAEHEIGGHLLPRRNARYETGPLQCGCAHASADEEGRALVLEERSALMDTGRKRELALRHWACDRARRGADFVEVVRELLRYGATVRRAVTIAVRCFRGSVAVGSKQRGVVRQGGLGRELTYLPAYLRVKAAFDGSPRLEQWFERGRASLEYAQYLTSLETAPFTTLYEFDDGRSSSTQTGT